MTITQETKDAAGLDAGQITNREVKSSMFTALFSDPKNAAELYRALEPGEDIGPEDIDYTTLSGVLFLARKNDMAFTVKKRVLVISEHQSTVNANMPLRAAIYYGRTMEKLIEPRALYRTGRIMIPTPEFYVFYNGNAPYPKEDILSLSDSYLEKTEEPMLQLKTKVLNINFPENHPLLAKCRPIYEYSWLIQKIKEGIAEGRTRDEAVIDAMKEAGKEGILTEFLREHGTEVSNMIFTQFNLEDALEVRGEEKFAEGEAIGELQKLISQIRKKHARGLAADAIAEMLEEDPDSVSCVWEELEKNPEVSNEVLIQKLIHIGESKDHH